VLVLPKLRIDVLTTDELAWQVAEAILISTCADAWRSNGRLWLPGCQVEH
jgi:hypothetical protein